MHMPFAFEREHTILYSRTHGEMVFSEKWSWISRLLQSKAHAYNASERQTERERRKSNMCNFLWKRDFRSCCCVGDGGLMAICSQPMRLNHSTVNVTIEDPLQNNPFQVVYSTARNNIDMRVFAFGFYFIFFIHFDFSCMWCSHVTCTL